MPSVSEIQASQWESEVVKVEEPVVVDFWHHMCAWCKKLNPIFAELPEAIPGVKFLKVNILESPENRKVAIDNGVMSTPTIKVFCYGRPIGELVGFKSREKFVSGLKEILNQKDSCLDQSTPLEV
jgi:thioredoxin 1